MTNVIRVRPRRDLRQDFARWAVAQHPKVRTVGADTFGVPPHLFTDMPEALLLGARVDGHPYVSPLEEATAPAGAGAPELVGVDTPDGFRVAVPGQPLPEVPAEAYGPHSVPLDFAPLDDAPGDGPTTVVSPGDNDGDNLAPGGDTATTPEAVTSEDTPGDTGDTAGDTGGDNSASNPDAPFPCRHCPRSFTSSRGREVHSSRAHPEV